MDKIAQELDNKAPRELTSYEALGHLRSSCDQVPQGLDVMTFEERQLLLRLVVEAHHRRGGEGNNANSLPNLRG